MEEEARLLLSLRYSQPKNLLEMLSGCTVQNIQYILLTQQSVHKLLNLEQLLQENGRLSHLHEMAVRWGTGYDLGITGVDLLKGAMVLIAHRDEWKLRRIASCRTAISREYICDGRVF